MNQIPFPQATVYDFATNKGEWKCSLIHQILLENLPLKVLSTPPPNYDIGCDLQIKRWNHNGMDTPNYSWKQLFDILTYKRKVNSMWRAPESRTLKLNTDGVVAWSLGIDQIHVELDNIEVVKGLDSPLHEPSTIKIIKNYMNRPWSVTLRSFPREANSLADNLAKLGKGRSLGRIVSTHPPTEAVRFLKVDQSELRRGLSH
ncbi:hypothetical protein F3Y22_tig00110348pilonHSYRG00186 [Hibiscus syriacus]|uniref:RNase H type-1 domain-containing protein n=1 Tax=Hibiscus syriacus TaxID=106335 RepID=A0A6A3AWS2_HIBSY|nr:hypothetical protein F3Y22_tig00110348pilonHSYRG00186 [Hibiscus syriacus]